MVETPVAEWPKTLAEMFGDLELKHIVQEVMKTRRVSVDDVVTYTPTERTIDGVVYEIKAADVPVKELMTYAASNCKSCNGKGYSIRYVAKGKIPNPQDYVILSDKPMESMTEPEKKLWVEVEKKKSTWKILLPCYCTLKWISKRESGVFSNVLGNVVARITYEKKQ